MRAGKIAIKEAGFTIVELMIALSILGVLLVTTTTILIQIGALYSKGVNAADLQNATRTVVADIAGQLEFSGKSPAGCNSITVTCFVSSKPYVNTADSTTETVYTYCIGNIRYSYVLDRELGSDPRAVPPQTSPHVLWRDTLTTDASTCPTLNLTKSDPASGPCFDVSGPVSCASKGDGYEMLGAHMRLTRFNMQQTPPNSGIYTVDVWTAFGDRDLVQPDPNGPPGRSICLDGPGTQFCSTANISTQLTGRVY